MKEEYVKIKEYLLEKEEEMIQLWEEIVNVDSGSKNVKGVERVAEILEKKMDEFGIQHNRIDSQGAGPILIGEWNQEKNQKPLIFIGHMDTVFADGTVLENPFRIDEKGNAHGPGVLDMKGGLVIALYAIRAIQTLGEYDRPIKCVFVGDEENLHMLSNTRQLIIDEVKGAVAAFNFETGYPDDGLVTGRKGGGIIDISVKGVAAHSGISPEKGRSAILEICQKVVQIESKNDIQRGKLINCGMIKGGIGENTIPGESSINIGIRFPTVAIRDEIINELQEITATQYVSDTQSEMRIRMLMDSMEATDDVMRLYHHIEKIAEDCGYGQVHSFEVGGVSDSGIVVSSGIPTVCALGVKGEGNHTKDEYAQASSLLDRTILAACSAKDLGGFVNGN